MTTVIEDERRGEHVATLSLDAQRLSLDAERLYPNHQPRVVRGTSTDRNAEHVFIEDERPEVFDERLCMFAEPVSSNRERLGERDERRRPMSTTTAYMPVVAPRGRVVWCAAPSSRASSIGTLGAR